MAKVKAVVEINEDVLKAAQAFAARKALSESEVVESALRRYLGFEILDEIWADQPAIDPDEALAIAVEEVRAHRAGG